MFYLKDKVIKNLFTTLLLFFAIICQAQNEYPLLNSYVTDNAEILTAEQLQQLSIKLKTFETETSN